MKRIIHDFCLLLSLLAVLSGCGKEQLSATALAGLCDGTLYLIEPETPYGKENSNY